MITRSPRKRVLRIAHLTDIHVQPEKDAARGMIRCLQAVHRLKPRPDLIFNGGDAVMDVFSQGRERARVLQQLWRSILRDYCEIPVIHCIGNHDVWGWDREHSGCSGEEPDYGKRWAMELFELEQRFYSFDRMGWHFIVLDSTFPHGNGYKARLDDEQFEWLQADLKRTPASMPVCVLSHIPILSASAYLDGNNEKTGDWVVPGAWMHIDARRLIELFWKHRNVKLCLSGHIHLYDRVDYNGVTYLCNGAVCGAWWNGDYHQTPPGFGLIDLHSDGTFESQYMLYLSGSAQPLWKG
ncbi:3',5'-cyclic adenosine monophosphate phosphodiesterase CpdA [bacterium HR15]|nr:3',5'-cyclic adenosine monophosphate phosphodiesterase CpdA [bacterium HR15]